MLTAYREYLTKGCIIPFGYDLKYFDTLTLVSIIHNFIYFFFCNLCHKHNNCITVKNARYAAFFININMLS